jgi:hypothetical protein
MDRIRNLAGEAAPTNEQHFESLLEPWLVGIGGWLGWFCFSHFVTILYLIAYLMRLHSPFYVLWNLLTVTVAVLVLVLLLRKSHLFFPAVCVEWVVRMATALYGVRVNWLSVHTHPYSPVAVRPYESFVVSVVLTVLWFMYFKRSKRVLATFGRNL